MSSKEEIIKKYNYFPNTAEAPILESMPKKSINSLIKSFLQKGVELKTEDLKSNEESLMKSDCDMGTDDLVDAVA
jgi:hypothetical protein